VDARIAGYREALFVAGLSLEPFLVWRLSGDGANDLGRMVKKAQTAGDRLCQRSNRGSSHAHLIELDYHRWRNRTGLFGCGLAGDMHLSPIEFFFDSVEGVVTNLSASPQFGESSTFGEDGMMLDAR
jgi:hypothetical protein